MKNLLIGVLSCQKYEERRARCLETWIPEATAQGVDVVFLIGRDDGPARREGLNLFLPCRDDYGSLSQKVQSFFRWALANCEFDYLFKCDDDTYIRIDRLLKLNPVGKEYIGAEWYPGVNYGSGGAGYLLGRRAVKIVADALQGHRTWAEDQLVGRCLGEAGVPFHADGRFIPFGNEKRRPRPDNDIISTHACESPWKAHPIDFPPQKPTDI